MQIMKKNIIIFYIIFCHREIVKLDRFMTLSLSYANTVLWCSRCKIHHFVSAPFERLKKIHQRKNADFICYQCYKSVLTRRGLWSLKLFWWRSASSELILKLFNKEKCYSITFFNGTDRNCLPRPSKHTENILFGNWRKCS